MEPNTHKGGRIVKNSCHDNDDNAYDFYNLV